MKGRLIVLTAIMALVIGIAGFLPVTSESSKYYRVQKGHAEIAKAGIGCLTGGVIDEDSLDSIDRLREYDIVFTDEVDEIFIRQECVAFIMDRREMGKHLWKGYLKILDDHGDDTPLVVVDDIMEWLVPLSGERNI